MEIKNMTENKEEDYINLQNYINEIYDLGQLKSHLIKCNHAAITTKRPDENFFRKLDSNMKKTRGFVRKLKTLNSSSLESMKLEFDGLNLSQYTGEMATALCESKRKMTDVMSGVEMCCLINVRYEDFAGHLYESLTKMLLGRKDSKIVNPTLYRINLRFFAELVSVSIFPDRGLSFLNGQLNMITSMDFETFNNLSIISAFAKFCGFDYSGLHYRTCRLAAEKYNVKLPESNLINCEKRRSTVTVLKNYYEHLLKYLTEKHKEVCNMRKQNNQILQTRGELTAERTEKFNTMLNYFETLSESSKIYADYIDEDFPIFVDPNEKQEDGGKNSSDNLTQDEAEVSHLNTTWYVDNDMRSFYEDIPDLSNLAGSQGNSHPKNDSKPPQTEPKKDELSTICDSIDLNMSNSEEIVQESPRDSSSNVEPLDESTDSLELPEDTTKTEEESEVSNVKQSFTKYLTQLSSCLNTEMIDKAAEEFCLHYNNRTNRKKLARSIFSVNRNRYDLLPLYARLVKILYAVVPDVGVELSEHLKKDFLWQLKVKNQINIESKLRTVRLIAELTKFGVMPTANCLNCLKVLIHDFSYHNIEMACSILESCGRFLYCHAESHQRAKVYLDWIIQKKSLLHLDSRYILMIENAYYATRPPEIVPHKYVEEIPLHFQYIRHLLQSDFGRGVVDFVSKKLCKYDWEDEETFNFIVSCFVEVWRYKYSNIHYVSAVVTCITKMRKSSFFYVVVVDRIFEGIKLGLETRNTSWKQRMVAMVKMVGELNSYDIIDSDTICDGLYSFLRYGLKFHFLAESVSSREEMKDCLFRIRLACILIEAIFKQFNDRAQLISFYGRRLDYFMIIFRQYFWLKFSDKLWDNTVFPRDVFAMFKGVTRSSLLDLPPCDSYEEANAAFGKLSTALYSNKFNNGDPLGDLHVASESKAAKLSVREEKINEIERKRQENIRAMNDKNDNDFIKAFDKMVSEASVPRQLERVKMPIPEITTPVIKFNGSANHDPSKMECRLITRKGKKQQKICLMVDKKTNLANKFLSQQCKEEDNFMKMHKKEDYLYDKGSVNNNRNGYVNRNN